MRYICFTSPTCSRCKIIKDLVGAKAEELGLEFIDITLPESQSLIDKYQIQAAGIIIETETGNQVPVALLLRSNY